MPGIVNSKEYVVQEFKGPRLEPTIVLLLLLNAHVFKLPSE